MKEMNVTELFKVEHDDEFVMTPEQTERNIRRKFERIQILNQKVQEREALIEN